MSLFLSFRFFLLASVQLLAGLFLLQAGFRLGLTQFFVWCYGPFVFSLLYLSSVLFCAWHSAPKAKARQMVLPALFVCFLSPFLTFVLHGAKEELQDTLSLTMLFFSFYWLFLRSSSYEMVRLNTPFLHSSFRSIFLRCLMTCGLLLGLLSMMIIIYFAKLVVGDESQYFHLVVDTSNVMFGVGWQVPFLLWGIPGILFLCLACVGFYQGYQYLRRGMPSRYRVLPPCYFLKER